MELNGSVDPDRDEQDRVSKNLDYPYSNLYDENFEAIVDTSNLTRNEFFFSKTNPNNDYRLDLQYRLIGNVSDLASSGIDFDIFCCRVAELIAQATGAIGASLFLYFPENLLLKEIGRFNGDDSYKSTESHVFTTHTGRLGRVINEKKVIVFGPDAYHEMDLPNDRYDINYEYGISVPIIGDNKILGSYQLMFNDRIFQSAEFLSTLGKVLGSYIKLISSAAIEVRDPAKSQLAVQILDSIESVIGPLASRSGVEESLTHRANSDALEALRSATPLTRDDVELLLLIAEGYSNEVIARKMCLSESAVKKRVGSLMRKLNLDNRVQLCAYAFRSGFIG